MGDNFLMHAVVYLAAAVFCVPIAKRLGMGSVLGYLLAGILIGPFVFGFIGTEGGDIMHFAQFGVVMMLFLIGLELEPAKFWKMRRMIGGVGVSQVLGRLSYCLPYCASLIFPGRPPWRSHWPWPCPPPPSCCNR